MCVCLRMYILLQEVYDVDSKTQISIFGKYNLHCINRYKNKNVIFTSTL